MEALRADVAGTGLEVDWLLVDNGSDAAGRARLASLPVERIDPGANLGYAGGVNLGVARPDAELVLVMNPDVIVLPGCVPALLERPAATAPPSPARASTGTAAGAAPAPAEMPQPARRSWRGSLAGRARRGGPGPAPLAAARPPPLGGPVAAARATT